MIDTLVKYMVFLMRSTPLVCLFFWVTQQPKTRSVSAAGRFCLDAGLHLPATEGAHDRR